jgi:hypothetical protein
MVFGQKNGPARMSGRAEPVCTGMETRGGAAAVPGWSGDAKSKSPASSLIAGLSGLSFTPGAAYRQPRTS